MDIVTIPANHLSQNVDKSKDAFHQRNQLGLDMAYSRKRDLYHIFLLKEILYISVAHKTHKMYMMMLDMSLGGEI